MHSIRQILQLKGSQTWTISPKATAYKALELMSEKNIGALLVVDSDNDFSTGASKTGGLVGIFSERDYTRKGILMGRKSKQTLVHEIMTLEVLYLEPHSTVDQGMALMTNKCIRHVPIMDAGQLVGIISIGDLVKQVINDQEVIINQLEQYIRG